jgi:hypothetical protein
MKQALAVTTMDCTELQMYPMDMGRLCPASRQDAAPFMHLKNGGSDETRTRNNQIDSLGL